MEEYEEYGTAPEEYILRTPQEYTLQEYAPLPRSTFYLEGAPLATLGMCPLPDCALLISMIQKKMEGSPFECIVPTGSKSCQCLRSGLTPLTLTGILIFIIKVTESFNIDNNNCITKYKYLSKYFEKNSC
jgi:hypothetical protein